MTSKKSREQGLVTKECVATHTIFITLKQLYTPVS